MSRLRNKPSGTSAIGYQSDMPKRLILLAFILLIIVLFLGPISSASVYLADKLAELPLVNRVMAISLVLIGFTISYWHYEQLNVDPARHALLSYTFAAIGMAGFYYLIYTSHGGCYTFSGNTDATGSVLDFIYFSFVTITTLGYGDIVPNHPFIRLLVVAQILFGAFLILHVTSNGCSPETCKPSPEPSDGNQL